MRSVPARPTVTRMPRRALRAFAIAIPFAIAGCHDSSDAIPATPPTPLSRAIGTYEALPGVRLAIVEIRGKGGSNGNARAGDVLTVRYSATTADGTFLNVAAMDGGTVFVSGPTNDYQRVIAEQSDLRARSVYQGAGEWTYTFAVPIPSTFLAPINDSTALSDGERTGQPLLAGTYTVGIELDASYTTPQGQSFVDAGNAAADFLLGGAAELAPRAVSAADNCNVCHTDLRVHGGRFKDVGLCVLCHTAGAEDSNVGDATPGVTIELKVLIHKLHDAAHLPSVLGVSTDADGNRVYPGQTGAIAPQPLVYADDDGELEDFSEVAFPVWPNLNIAMPRDAGYSTLSGTDPDGTGPLRSARSAEDQIRTGATACAKCHGDPDAGGPLAAPTQGELAFVQTTRRACGSCHDDIDWTRPYVANGQTMPPQLDDAHCIECHANEAANQPDPALKPLSVREAHVHPLLDTAIDPGVNSVITAVTGGTGPGGNFQAGDAPAVTFTLRNDAGADIGLSSLDSCAAVVLGPTSNRQAVMAYPSPNGVSLNPFDFSGRLQASSTSNKGSMSKVVFGSPALAETLVVQFSSGTGFTVTRIDPATGAVNGSLGTGSLPAAASTNPSGSSLSALELSPALGSGTFQITFSSATHFDITGIVGGSGDLPASTSASTRFESTELSFNLSVGATAFAPGNTIHAAAFRGDAANPVLFGIVAGRTAFAAGDRFYYELVPDGPSYTVQVPMDIPLEFLADTGGSPGTNVSLPAAGNLPVYYGRQQLWEAATTATTTMTAGAAAALDRFVDVAAASGFANGDTVVLEPAAGVGLREYVQIAPARSDGVIAAAGETTTRLWFKTPLRYAHDPGVTVTKVTLAFKQEGTAYSLDPANGIVTSIGAFTANRAIVMSYRTAGRFGYRRHSMDALQAVFVPPPNDSAEVGQEQGDWHGLPLLSGTYTADIWLYKNISLGRYGEVQTYRSTSNAGTQDFLFGTALQIEPRAIISASTNCYTCHDDVLFHGGGRRGVDACLTCHAISGAEDKPRWDTPKVSGTSTDTALTPGVAIEFRQMLHKIHRGSDLANAATYTVVGNGGNPSTYEEVEFPAMPGGVKQCIRCHGNDAWKQPADRMHPSASLPVKTWTVVCGACHDSPSAQAHIAVNTSGSGAEACAICHGPGDDQAVEKVHVRR